MQVSDEEYLRFSRSRVRNKATVAAGTGLSPLTEANTGATASTATGRTGIAVATPPTRTRTAVSSGARATQKTCARQEEIHRIVNTLSHTPEVREPVVASLRQQMEAGKYEVAGQQIAEMMLRRMSADQMG